MKLALTLMVRDEVDIISAMLEHHLSQGIDTIIVTDNGSRDGTTEILQDYEQRGLVDLRFDERHQKQQGVTVTGMARDAKTAHNADWVINADADEFWLPSRPGITLHDAFEHIPSSIGAFDVPVFDMIGAPAMSGTGLQRLIYKDLRPEEDLHKIGLHAHATPDAVHVGDPDIVVSQGNHFVNIPNQGEVPPDFAIEVLHFPWRSWAQFSGKVRNAGTAYRNSPDLVPSPNHHGMRDFRRLEDGTLFGSYLCRHPTAEQIQTLVAEGELVRDDRISAGIPSPIPDVAIDEGATAGERALGAAVATWESRALEAERQCAALTEEVRDQTVRLAQTQAELERMRNRKVVRYIDRSARFLHRSSG